MKRKAEAGREANNILGRVAFGHKVEMQSKVGIVASIVHDQARHMNMFIIVNCQRSQHADQQK